MAINRLRILFLSVFCGTIVSLMAQKLQTQILHPDIKTLQIKMQDAENLSRPILELNNGNVLDFSFDELSHEARYYTYTIYHCNADWTTSNIVSSEYLSGFTTVDIDDYELSYNTQQIYTHYRFSLPNDDLQLKLSGNYAVRIYEDGDTEKTVAWACFSVVEPDFFIDVNFRANTDIDINEHHQQLDIDISPGQHNVRDPFSELKIVVRQNGRTDNEAFVTKPTFVEKSRFRYINNKNLIFEGGNEYRHFDILSEYILGEGVDKVDFENGFYHATLFQSEFMNNSYSSEQDANGQFVINRERSDYSEVEADYMWVHYTLPTETPFFDGSLYVGGDMNYNLLNSNTRMHYDNELKAYVYSQYLKQGGYNFQYWFKPKIEKRASTLRTEGSYWQAQNEYTIYVYHRPWGERYDKLVGYKSILAP